MKRLSTLAFAALTLFGGNVYATSESENSRIQCEKRYIMLTKGYVRQYIGTTNASLCPKGIYKTIVRYHIFYATLPPQGWGTSFESILTKKSAKKYSCVTALARASRACYMSMITVKLFFQYEKCLLSSTKHVQSIGDDCLWTLHENYETSIENPVPIFLKIYNEHQKIYDDNKKSTFIKNAVSVLNEMMDDKKKELRQKGIFFDFKPLDSRTVYVYDRYDTKVSSLDELPKLDAYNADAIDNIDSLVAVVQLEYAYPISIVLLAKQMAQILLQDQ